MTKEEWENLKVGQTVYYGPKKTLRIITSISEKKSLTMDSLRQGSGSSNTIYPKNERHKFFLKP